MLKNLKFHLSDMPLSAVVVTCSLLPTPTNGQRSSSRRNYNDRVSFRCNTGYILSGSSSRTCQSTGLWSGTQPTCNSKLFCPACVWLQRRTDIYILLTCNATYYLISIYDTNRHALYPSDSIIRIEELKKAYINVSSAILR